MNARKREKRKGRESEQRGQRENYREKVRKRKTRQYTGLLKKVFINFRNDRARKDINTLYVKC